MTKVVFFSKIIKKTTNILERIPIIKTVYSAIKQITEIAYSDSEESVYKKVVAVEFPRKGLYAIGFLTADKNTALKDFLADKEIVNVFVPTAPNPTSGFLLCIPKEDIHPLNMSVEWAFKLIVSGGYLTEELVKEKKENVNE
ncbi:transporter [Fusobacterium animalis ATCC 51191]|uniref:Transporter n=6 Tax=Fusobacterium TaxID=848 RepID=F9EKG5_9FUSO|nr:transporter [Fusobacterium animalis ATCC 51191]